MPEGEAEERAKRATDDGKRVVQARAVFAAEDVAAAELQPFRYAGVDSQTSTEFKWVVWKEPAHITLVYAWTISGGVTGKSGKQRKRKAASGLGALLAALRHHHGPDDTAQLEVGSGLPGVAQGGLRERHGGGEAEGHRVPREAARRSERRQLERRAGAAGGGEATCGRPASWAPWQGPLPWRGPGLRPGQGPCRKLTGKLHMPSHTAPVSGDGEPWGALFRLLSSACSPLRERRQLAGRLEVVSLPDMRHTCSPPLALLRLRSCSPLPTLLRLLSSSCSPPPARLRLRCSRFDMYWGHQP